MARLARHKLAWLTLALLLFATGAMGGERETLDGWRAQLDQVQAALQRDGLSDQDLAGLRDSTEPVRLGARAMAAQLAPRLQVMQSQLGDESKADGAVPTSDPAAQGVAQSLEALQAALRD